jgi:hypothetical protein
LFRDWELAVSFSGRLVLLISPDKKTMIVPIIEQKKGLDNSVGLVEDKGIHAYEVRPRKYHRGVRMLRLPPHIPVPL